MDGAADTAEAVVSDDAEPVDRDRLDPLTLRFVDPALERAFQIATLDGARRRHRWGLFVNIPLWIVGPALAIAVFPTIDPRPILIGATVMVVIGERTFAMIADVAECRPLGTPELKGKSVPVAVYELLGLRASP